jgi:hypothetical protein
LKTTDRAKATAVAWTPVASPTPIARKMQTASLVSRRVLRKLTAATIPPRLNARAMLFLTRITTPATTTGRMMRVWTTDCRNPFRWRVKT